MDWDIGLVSELFIGTSLEDALLKAYMYEENHYFEVEYGIHLDHCLPGQTDEGDKKQEYIESVIDELEKADVRVSLGNPAQRAIKVGGRTMKLSQK